MLKVYIFKAGELKIAVKSSEPVENFTNFLVKTFNLAPNHLYYYADEKEHKLLLCQELERAFWDNLLSDSPTFVLANLLRELGIGNFRATLTLSVLKSSLSEAFQQCPKNEYRIYSFEEFLKQLDEAAEGFMDILLKYHFNVITPKVKVKDMVNLLGNKIKLIYDLGRLEEIHLSLWEILTSKNFKRIYGNVKIPAVVERV